ncbi:TetR family transcriptional regulator [Nocardioides albertanoniae]|uniref:TetR family transcriptional regulator n=1 Tax=Nocardioides albertanoniae TaxID=1175486 RepID=A0A543AB89_9ACTN|nr:TetR/AcrR family transcriptional regulator [Nocardioides albertanoniae]TQL69819.1 TetR family transcriptional regulator [Nocardioides albertanoniae]
MHTTAPEDEPGSLFARALADVAEPIEDEAVTAKLLDAASEQFRQVGIKRTTMDGVAKRAGVSRITIYRRFANKDDLVQQVVRREFRAYFDQFVNDIADAADAAERVEIGFASAMRATRGNPLIGGLLALETDSLVHSIVGDGGRTLATIAGFVAGQLRREQRAGNVPADVDADLVAELMVRTSTSFLVTPSTVVDIDDDEQLRALARLLLVPLIDPGARPK